MLFTPYDMQPDYNRCGHPPTYFTYYYQTTIRLSNSVLTGNSAPCLTCSGGALHLDRGGQLILRYCAAFMSHCVLGLTDMVVWNPAPPPPCPPLPPPLLTHTPHPTPPATHMDARYLLPPPPSPWMYSNVTIANNTAGEFGGGLSLGLIGEDTECGLIMGNGTVGAAYIPLSDTLPSHIHAAPP